MMTEEVALQTTLSRPAVDEALARMRSLVSSLRVVLACAQDVEENSEHVGSALFLANEIGDQVEQIELQVIGGVSVEQGGSS